MFKSNGGFTLVELIVVIAVLAILAGIAVPAYGTYIEKAKAAQQIVNDSYKDRLDEANKYLETVGESTIAPDETKAP